MNIHNELYLKSQSIKEKYYQILLINVYSPTTENRYNDLKILCDDYNTFKKQHKQENNDHDIEIIEHSIYCFFNFGKKMKIN